MPGERMSEAAAHSLAAGLEQARRNELADEPTLAEVMARSGSRPCTPEEFEALFGDLPTDDEG